MKSPPCPSCPSCHKAMTPLSLPSVAQGTVELDLCFGCQGIWLDRWESQQIAPGGTIELFKLLHAHRDEMRQALASRLDCPRCSAKLQASHDMVKSGKFNYYRCQRDNGRFIVFAQFMIEKGFVRQMHQKEIEELATRIQIVYCSSCGAAVDIRRDSACSHCRAPIAILDPGAVEKALANYQQADAQREHLRTHGDPMALAEMVMATERIERRYGDGSQEAPIGDLMLAGAAIVLGLGLLK